MYCAKYSIYSKNGIFQHNNFPRKYKKIHQFTFRYPKITHTINKIVVKYVLTKIQN